MRIRAIRPAFWKHETLAELPRDARLFFIGLWSVADGVGILECRPKRLAAEIFPYDRDAGELACAWVDGLVAGGFVRRYDAKDTSWLWIPTFRRHQYWSMSKEERVRRTTFPHPPGVTAEQLHSAPEDRHGGGHGGTISEPSARPPKTPRGSTGNDRPSTVAPTVAPPSDHGGDDGGTTVENEPNHGGDHGGGHGGRHGRRVQGYTGIRDNGTTGLPPKPPEGGPAVVADAPPGDETTPATPVSSHVQARLAVITAQGGWLRSKQDQSDLTAEWLDAVDGLSLEQIPILFARSEALAGGRLRYPERAKQVRMAIRQEQRASMTSAQAARHRTHAQQLEQDHANAIAAGDAAAQPELARLIAWITALPAAQRSQIEPRAPHRAEPYWRKIVAGKPVPAAMAVRELIKIPQLAAVSRGEAVDLAPPSEQIEEQAPPDLSAHDQSDFAPPDDEPIVIAESVDQEAPL